jgi:hypothetical protein
MKNPLLKIGFVAALFFTVFSCSKNAAKSGSTTSSTGVLTLSQTLVNKGQPLIASLPSGVTAEAVKWSVSTNTPTHITQANGQALILFSSDGTYRVTAAYSTADSSYSDTAAATVVVNDSTYSPPPPTDLDTSGLGGDLITLTPSFDSLGNLLFLAQTRNSYGCAPYLVNMIYETPGTGGLLTLNFYEVISNSTGTCNGIANPATAFMFTNTAVWPDGTYPITVNVGVGSYTGSVIISGDGYSFIWNNTSGVVMSQMKLSR